MLQCITFQCTQNFGNAEIWTQIPLQGVKRNGVMSDRHRSACSGQLCAEAWDGSSLSPSVDDGVLDVDACCVRELIMRRRTTNAQRTGGLTGKHRCFYTCAHSSNQIKYLEYPWPDFVVVRAFRIFTVSSSETLCRRTPRPSSYLTLSW